MNKSLFKRNPSIFITICIVLFIPLIIAVVFAFTVDPFEVKDDNVTKILVKHDGNSYEFDSEKNKDVLDIYTGMLNNSTEINKDYGDVNLEGKECYEITFYEASAEPLVYKFYPSTNVNECIYVSPDNTAYYLDKAAAEKIITREEYSAIDTENLLPELVVSGLGGNNTLKPDSYDWTYTAISGSVTKLTDDGKADNPVIKFDDTEDGTLLLEFSKQPDSFSLTIKEGNDIKFNDKYENLSDVKLHYEKDTKLSVTAFAEWYELEGAEYYGSAKYSFNLLYDCAPSYQLVDKSLDSGDFTILKLTDFNDGELLKITSDIGLANELPVYDYKGEKITFIPLTSYLTEGEHVIGLATQSGHTETTTKISVKAGTAKYKTQTLIVDVKKEKEDNNTQLSDSLTEKSLEEFEELVKKYSAQSVNEQLFTGEKFKFDYPTGSDKSVTGGAQYGMTRTVTNRNAINLSYVSSGVDLACTKEQDLKCANSGKVVFAGKTTLLGNTVIVDHGFGILSYYGNLDSISVKVGDAVTKGETVVGKAGSTGFACKLGADGATVEQSVTCHYAVSLNGSFINPKYIAKGIYID